MIERLLRVIDEGRRVATYKLALILGIVDAVAMSPGVSELPTRLIAERVVALYYLQTRAFVAGGRVEQANGLRSITSWRGPAGRTTPSRTLCWPMGATVPRATTWHRAST